MFLLSFVFFLFFQTIPKKKQKNLRIPVGFEEVLQVCLFFDFGVCFGCSDVRIPEGLVETGSRVELKVCFCGGSWEIFVFCFQNAGN